MRKLITIGLVLAVAATIWWFSREPENGEDGVSPSLTTEEYREAIRLRTEGISRIENIEWDVADESFVRLGELVPEENLPHRNLAIVRTLSLVHPKSPFEKAKDPEAYQTAFERAVDAIESLKKLGGEEEALASLLMGKLLVYDGQAGEGIKLLQAAAAAQPERGDYWFAIYQGAQTDADLQMAPEVVDALAEAHKAMPGNLFVLRSRLELLARTHDPALKDVMSSALELVEPLEYPQMASVTKQLANAVESFDGTETQPLELAARLASNVLNAQEPTRMDGRRADRNLLEYLAQEFSEPFRTAAADAGVLPKLESPIPIALRPADILPDLDSVTQVAFADMNLDGVDDLVVARGGSVEVYSRGSTTDGDWSLVMNTGEASRGFTHFRLLDIDRDFDRTIDMKAPRLLMDPDGDRKIPSDAVSENRWYDTDLDLIAWSESEIVLFRNDRGSDDSRTFIAIDLPAGLAGTGGITDVQPVDLEHDGDLDIAVADPGGLTLWRNLDGTTFESMATSVSGDSSGVQVLAVADWNRDVAIDIVGLGDEHGVMENAFHGRFRWLPDDDVLSQLPTAATAAVHDLDGNVSWDLLIAGGDGVHSVLTTVSEAGLVSLLRVESLIQQPMDGAILVDLDNDGFSDCVAWSSSRIEILRGEPDGQFEPFDLEQPDVSGVIQSVESADLDADGDFDLMVVSDGQVRPWLNDGGNANNWIRLVLRADQNPEQFPSQRCNMHGVGAVVELRSGSLYQSQIASGPRLHFGLGKRETIDAIRVIWTDGVPQNVIAEDVLNAGATVVAPQILLGSCPYIYTWTGERFEFFSDCLWAAPLGLVQSTGDLAPTREWEHLLIPGDRLALRDGRYVIQLTEELREAAYFDEVKLLAVDHPDGIDIFTNEKVGPPNVTEPQIHTVVSPLPPRSVLDSSGRNVTPQMSSQDGDYVQPFGRRIMQGLTEPWTLEFDFGSLPDTTNVKLVLVGWIFPTDTNLNAALHQNSSLPDPQPPSIATIAETGEWETVISSCGFPGGKTKTIVVDLSGGFPSADHRIRLSSSMELYWDSAFVISGEDSVPTVSQPCNLIAADIHFRGISRRTYSPDSLFRDGHAPEGYDYENPVRQLRWPPMRGRFTRYGDVTELLSFQDDLSVILGAGDELTVEFAEPGQPLPTGWRRDFVLYNVGWDKDAHLNTLSGQSSEPFPTAAMTNYPYGDSAGDQTNSDRAAQNEKWQTRTYSTRAFLRQIRDGAPSP